MRKQKTKERRIDMTIVNQGYTEETLTQVFEADNNAMCQCCEGCSMD